MKKHLLFIALLLFGCSSHFISYKTTSNPQNLKKHVQALIYDGEYRNFKNVKELNRVAEYIRSEIGKNGFSCSFQKYIVDGREYKNVICKMGDTERKRIVVGAHYDVYGDQEGADDNASGVAGLIELSRVLHGKQKNLKVGVELVAYTLEEPPFFNTENMGSYVHALSLANSKTDIIGMVALEMIGYFSDQNIQRYPMGLSLFYPKRADFVAAVSNFGSRRLAGLYEDALEGSSNIQVEKLIAPSFIKGVDFSDHRNYWKFGYNAIMITDTAFFRNSNYHKKTDTIDTLNFNYMGKVIDALSIMILNLK